MDRNVLIDKIKQYISCKEEKITESCVEIHNMLFVNLRDCILGLGTILEEDFNMQTYVLSVAAGYVNMNNAIVAIQIEDNKLYMIGYAREGIIHQNTAKKAIAKIVDRISDYV